MSYHWYDAVGNIGMVCILAAYVLLQMEKMSAKQPLYSVLNGLGAALILVSLYFAFNLSAVLIESAWLMISLAGLWKSLRT